MGINNVPLILHFKASFIYKTGASLQELPVFLDKGELVMMKLIPINPHCPLIDQVLLL